MSAPVELLGETVRALVGLLREERRCIAALDGAALVEVAEQKRGLAEQARVQAAAVPVELRRRTLRPLVAEAEVNAQLLGEAAGAIAVALGLGTGAGTYTARARMHRAATTPPRPTRMVF